MKRVFISTNGSLRGLYRGDAVKEKKLQNCNLTLLNNNDVVYYNFETNVFDTNSVNSSLIVIKDSSPTNNESPVNSLIQNINTETDFLLHHSREPNHQIFVVKKFHNKKPGQHTPGNEHLYQPVFDIIFDENVYGLDKVVKIFEVLGFTDEEVKEKDELEAKLSLLHKCLTPDEAKSATQIPNYNLIKDMVESIMINNEPVIEYLTKQSDCFDEENYIKPLTTLRDKLLA
jgi:hypothetical protein